jgi:hypothetical protein
MQNYEELREMLSLILLKIDQLSVKVDVIESKIASNSNKFLPSIQENFNDTRTHATHDVKKNIEKMRAELMKKHQAKMQEVKNMGNKLPTDMVNIEVDKS